MRLDHLLSRETLIVSDEVEPSGSLAWKTDNIFFGSRRKGREARSETAISASGFRGSAPEGAFPGLRAP